MGQKMADANIGQWAAFERRQILADGIVQAQASIVAQLQNQNGGHYLDDGAGLKHRLRRGLQPALDIKNAGGGQPRLAVRQDANGGAGD